jgi:hypothetical protein
MVAVRTRVTRESRFDARRTGFLAAGTRADRYRTTPDSSWQGIYDGWEEGKHVESVSHFGRHQTDRGDILILESLKGEVLAQVQVVDIIMVQNEALSDEHLQALGYASRQEYDQDYGRLIMSGKAWFFKVEHVSPQQIIDQKPQ